MFGLLDAVVTATARTVDKAISDPVGFVVDSTVQPVVDTLDVLEGLTEGELRERAALRLGADVAAGMAASEILDVLSGGANK